MGLIRDLICDPEKVMEIKRKLKEDFSSLYDLLLTKVDCRDKDFERYLCICVKNQNTPTEEYMVIKYYFWKEGIKENDFRDGDYNLKEDSAYHYFFSGVWVDPTRTTQLAKEALASLAKCEDGEYEYKELMDWFEPTYSEARTCDIPLQYVKEEGE